MSKLQQDKIFIIDALRTPIGSPHKGLSAYTATDLASVVIKNIIKRNKLRNNQIDQVIMGNVVSAGLGQNFSRQAAILGGLSVETPAFTVNNVCGAGVQAVILGIQSILTGENGLVVCGGAESATHCPKLAIELKENEQPKVLNSLINDGLTCHITGRHMGEIVESMAQKHKISRRQQDEYSLESHQKGAFAQDKNVFVHEIIPVRNSNRKIISQDERVRKNISMESFFRLPAAFHKNGTVTAGNSSVPSDGAAACLIASAAITKKLKLKPLARICAYYSIAVNPRDTFETITAAVKGILKKSGLTMQDIDLFEIGEAFAAQMVLAKKTLKIPQHKLNIYGGDIAFGHPLGAAGARILVTLAHALRNNKLRRGLACVSYGGGGAAAIIIEDIHG